MPAVIPVTNDARQRFRTVLGGQDASLAVWWQPSDEAWYFTLTLGNTDIVSSMRLTEEGEPLSGVVSSFEGQILVYGTGDPARDAWTETHSLLYYTPAEWEAR